MCYSKTLTYQNQIIDNYLDFSNYLFGHQCQTHLYKYLLSYLNMFKSLREKFTSWFKKKEPVEEPVKESPKEKPKKEQKKPKSQKPKKKESPSPPIPKEEISQEQILPPAEEPIEKQGFFAKLVSKLSTSTLTQEQFDSIFPELEMILLENNVALQVVDKIHSELSKDLVGIEIKKSKVEETILNSLKETISNILIEPPNLLEQIKKKLSGPFTIIFVGINGSGKCVHGNSKIQLSNGEIIQIKDLYNKYKNILPKEALEDGNVIDISRENIIVPSFNQTNLNIENKKATHIWELNKKELIEIKLENGNDYAIKITPEHPFFVLRNGLVAKTRADEITESDYISIPGEIKIEGKTQSLFEDIKNLDLFIYLTPEEAKKCLALPNKTLKEIHKKLKFKKSYCEFTTDVRKGKIPIEFVEGNKFNFIKIKEKKAHNPIIVPTFLTTDFAEFLGYVVGDGHIEKNYVEITNEDPEVIARLKELSKILFNIAPSIKRDMRTKQMFKIQLCSKTLVEIMKIFGLFPGKKGKELKVPSQILRSSNEIVRAFIKAYFDCDSYPHQNIRQIELVSESKIIIQQINLLLRRFGILSTISKKYVKTMPYWRLIIKAKHAETYAEKIGYLIKKKQNKINCYKKIGEFQGHGNQDMVPLGKALKALRLQLGFSIAEIQKYVGGYGIHEKKGTISKKKLKRLTEYYRLKSQGIFSRFLTDISTNNNLNEKYSNSFVNGIITSLKNNSLINMNNNQILLTKNGLEYLQMIKEKTIESTKLLETFEYLALSNVCWLPIKEINKTINDKEFVYDLTIEDNHSFIAEGFIVHNTTTIAKMAYFLKQNKISCVLAAADTFRAASIEQLKIHAQKLSLPIIAHQYGADPASVAFDAKKYAEAHNIQVVLIDTAGRMYTKTNLIKEMEKIVRISSPDLKLFIGESITGNDVVEQAKTFNEAISIDGIILSKADVDEKAGAILSVSQVTNKPIYFLGVGQNYSNLQPFKKSSVLKNLGLEH